MLPSPRLAKSFWINEPWLAADHHEFAACLHVRNLAPRHQTRHVAHGAGDAVARDGQGKLPRLDAAQREHEIGNRSCHKGKKTDELNPRERFADAAPAEDPAAFVIKVKAGEGGEDEDERNNAR